MRVYKVSYICHEDGRQYYPGENKLCFYTEDCFIYYFQSFVQDAGVNGSLLIEVIDLEVESLKGFKNKFPGIQIFEIPSYSTAPQYKTRIIK
jgi:hypothetical protein